MKKSGIIDLKVGVDLGKRVKIRGAWLYPVNLSLRAGRIRSNGEGGDLEK